MHRIKISPAIDFNKAKGCHFHVLPLQCVEIEEKDIREQAGLLLRKL